METFKFLYYNTWNVEYIPVIRFNNVVDIYNLIVSVYIYQCSNTGNEAVWKTQQFLKHLNSDHLPLQ